MARKRNNRKRKSKNHSTIDQHKRESKELVPPLAQIAEMNLQSWRDDRLPGMLWAALLTSLERKKYLELFREVANNAEKLGEGFDGLISHTPLSKLSEDQFDTLLAPVIGDDEARESLGSIHMFSDLPDRCHWIRHVGEPGDTENIDLLARSVAKNLFHQSESATDIRWLRVLTLTAAKKMHFGEKFEERVREFYEYPYRGDMRSVRPSIRAAEGAVSTPDMNEDNVDWTESFWKTCWEKSPCISRTTDRLEEPDRSKVLEQIETIYSSVVEYFHESTETTDVDPRKDAVFGIVLYSLSLCFTLNMGFGHRRAEGRLVIRTLVESVVTLSFLLKKDDDTIWQKYRTYGTGQAKLAYLKLEPLEEDDLPDFVKIEELEELANDDVWLEFQNVNIGSWSGSDLRKMSEVAGVKDLYDKYYGWPSGFVHGQWGAVRDTVFEVCLNPLHRLHRIPAAPRTDMGSVASDALRLTNVLLDRLNAAYPPFKPRLKHQ